MLNPCDGDTLERSTSGAPPAGLLIDYWLMQMLILLKPPPKQVLIIKGTAALDLTAAKQLFVMSVLLPFSRCESEGADREGKARMRDEAQAWVRWIAACRGQTLSSANIVIWCSIRLQLSDTECRQCVSAAPGATLCFLQFHLAARPTRSHRLLVGSQNKSPAVRYRGMGYLGTGCRLGRLDLPCCLNDYITITTPCVL